MFSLLFGFAFGVVAGFLLLAFAVIEKLKTHDCTYVSGAIKWVERPTLRATDAEDSAPSQAVSNAGNLSNSDGFAVTTRRS